MKRLKADLKTRDFQRAYLLYGEEKFLIRYYTNQMQEAILPIGFEMMNLDIFDGKAADINQIADAIQTLPFLNDIRLVIVKDSRLFVVGRKDDSEKMAALLSQIPETTVLVFIEDDIDKRSRMYKKMEEMGRAIEFKTPTEKELSDWIINMCKKRSKAISRDTAQILLRTTGRGMSGLETEIDKLAGYCAYEKEITSEAIEMICTPSLETRVFDLVDALGSKKPEKALDLLSNMLAMKEQPLVILAMIIRQFRLMAQSKALQEKGRSDSDIAKALAIHPYVAGECLRQSRNFSQEELLQGLRDCLKADLDFKNGRINDRIALETLIIQYAS